MNNTFDGGIHVDPNAGEGKGPAVARKGIVVGISPGELAAIQQKLPELGENVASRFN